LSDVRLPQTGSKYGWILFKDHMIRINPQIRLLRQVFQDRCGLARTNIPRLNMDLRIDGSWGFNPDRRIHRIGLNWRRIGHRHSRENRVDVAQGGSCRVAGIEHAADRIDLVKLAIVSGAFDKLR
jgi:hypothetical protein